MLTFKFKQLGHGPTVKIGQVCEQTELMISVQVQIQMGIPAAFYPIPRMGRAQCGNFGPKWSPTNRPRWWHDVRGQGNKRNKFKRRVSNPDGDRGKGPDQKCNRGVHRLRSVRSEMSWIDKELYSVTCYHMAKRLLTHGHVMSDYWSMGHS